MPRPKNKAWNEFPKSYYLLLDRFKNDQSNLTLDYSTRSKAETARADLYHFFRVLQNSAGYETAKEYAACSRHLVLSVRAHEADFAQLVISWNAPVAERLEQALKEQT